MREGVWLGFRLHVHLPGGCFEPCVPRAPVVSCQAAPGASAPSWLGVGASECETPFPKFSLKHESHALFFDKSSGLRSTT